MYTPLCKIKFWVDWAKSRDSPLTRYGDIANFRKGGVAAHGGGVINFSWWVESNHIYIIYVAPPTLALHYNYNLTQFSNIELYLKTLLFKAISASIYR
jgi:hypothetical protein